MWWWRSYHFTIIPKLHLKLQWRVQLSYLRIPGFTCIHYCLEYNHVLIFRSFCNLVNSPFTCMGWGSKIFELVNATKVYKPRVHLLIIRHYIWYGWISRRLGALMYLTRQFYACLNSCKLPNDTSELKMRIKFPNWQFTHIRVVTVNWLML